MNSQITFENQLKIGIICPDKRRLCLLKWCHANKTGQM